jgi:NADH:ubiquinone reductase (H+-translocating)
MTRPASSSAAPKRVVIVGGGFGGLYAAKALRNTDVQVTLLDRRNFHLFQPLLYQVASGWLSPSEIASPLRSVFEKDRNIEVLLGEVVDIDVAAREVVLADGERLPYEALIVSAGAVVNHFGHDDWVELAPGVKTIENAVEIRRRVLLAFEAAERELDPAARTRWLTFIIVGGGTTGVEMAGVLGELARDILRGNFRRIDPGLARIVLVQSGERVLPDFGEKLAASATRDLAALGVEIRTGTRVSAIDEGGVQLSGPARAERVDAGTVIWAAGVRANPLAVRLAERVDIEVAAGGRLPVEPDLSLPGHPEVFVAGDMAAIRLDDREAPGVAPAAMQAGRHAAKSAERLLAGERPRPFRYHDRGELATVGRGRAVAALGRLHFDGFLAWIIWVFVHLLYLVEFENRFVVVTRWAWDFFRHERGSRLITGTPLAPAIRGPAAAARSAEAALDGSVGAEPATALDLERLADGAARRSGPGSTGGAGRDQRRGVAGSQRRFGTVVWDRQGRRVDAARVDQRAPVGPGGKERTG